MRGDTVDLVFAFHHAILDGWSVASLIRELLADYLVQVGVDVRPVDAGVHSATMLAEYVRLEKEVRESPVAQQFWRRALEGRGRPHWAPTLPTNRRPPQIRT